MPPVDRNDPLYAQFWQWIPNYFENRTPTMCAAVGSVLLSLLFKYPFYKVGTDGLLVLIPGFFTSYKLVIYWVTLIGVQTFVKLTSLLAQ